MAIFAAVLRLFRVAVHTGRRIVLYAGIFFILLGTVGTYLAEGGTAGSQFANIWNCLWWTLVTMTTVGYGDMVPVTVAGRVIGVLCMIGGPVLMVTLVSIIGVAIYDKWTKGVRGMAKINSRGHVVICGWNNTAADIVSELRLSEAFRAAPITIIDEHIERKPAADGISFVRGNASEVGVLERAGIAKAAYAIVLAENATPAADQKTVLTVLAIETTNPAIISCAQLNDANNEPHLARAGCDIVVNTSSLTSKLLAMSLQNPAVNRITRELVSGGQGNEIYRVALPAEYAGRPFADALRELKGSADAIAIGIERDGQCRLNPPADTVLQGDDWLFLVAEEAPSL